MKKQNKDFSQQLQQRIPNALKQEQERVIVKPVDMLAPQDESTQEDKTTNLQESEAESIQVNKPAELQSSESISKQTSKTPSPQIGKYTTHLRPDTIKAIKRYAVEYEIKDYEVVQEALDQFFK